MLYEKIVNKPANDDDDLQFNQLGDHLHKKASQFVEFLVVYCLTLHIFI